MSFFGDLRQIVLLRRIARAMEQQADAMNELRMIERERWARETHAGRAKPKPVEIGTFDIQEANERWHKELEAQEFGGTLEDRTQ